jgi:hypothetical protein
MDQSIAFAVEVNSVAAREKEASDVRSLES